MPETAFVVFEEKLYRGRPGLLASSGVWKLPAGTALYRLLHRKRFERGIRTVPADSTESFLMVRLPFPKSMLPMFDKTYLTRYISRISAENGCVRCFFPPDSVWGMDPGLFFTDDAVCFIWEDVRNRIFKSLLLPILDEIYTRNGIRLDRLDIVFLCGLPATGLLPMLKQVEPRLNSVNIAAKKKKDIENSLAELSGDSGLSIFISGDFDGLLRNADLIINLEPASALSEYRIKPHALVLQFGDPDRGGPVRGQYPVVNGVRFFLPEQIYSLLGSDILQNYSREDLADILLALRSGLFHSGNDEMTAESAAGLFKSLNCRISGYRGRRGELLPDEIRKALGIKG